ncbi:MAG: hypothetical protein K5669_00395 [Lachnospiraceae bacterium]|nr:hypothetical protein [Lachnospiraceae bacterium]
MPNLLKTSYVNISNKDKRVIDMNALMELKLEKMREEEQRKAQENFVAGLNAEVIDPDGEVLGEGAEGDSFTEGLFADDGQPLYDPDGNENSENPEGVYGDAGEGAHQSAAHTGVRNGSAEFIEKANREAASIIEDAQIKAKQIIDEATEKAGRDADGIYAEANERGYNEGFEKASLEYEQKKAELDAKAKELESLYGQKLEEMESELVDTITDVYQHIFNIDLSNNREILLHLIENTMRKIESTKSYLIHVSSDDAAFVNMQKKILEEAATLPDSIVEVIEDMSLGKNECFIETDGGIFDCGVDTELTELSNKLKILSYEKNIE